MPMRAEMYAQVREFDPELIEAVGDAINGVLPATAGDAMARVGVTTAHLAAAALSVLAQPTQKDGER